MWGLGLQREGKQLTGRWEEQVFGKEMFAVPPEQTMGHRQDFDLQLLPVPHSPPQPMLFAVPCGDSSLPGLGPLSKFF